MLHCRVGRVPFMYLRLLIGGDSRRLVFWGPMLDHIKSRLYGWKSQNLSSKGRLILLKFILASMPINALSFFKVFEGAIVLLALIFMNSLRGGSENLKRIVWID